MVDYIIDNGVYDLAQREEVNYAKAIRNSLKLGGEIKFFQQEVSVNFPENTDWSSCSIDDATVKCMFAPVTGSNYYNRVGNRCHVIGISVLGVLATSFYDTVTPTGKYHCSSRILVVLNKQCNATAIASQNVITAGVLSNYVHDNRNFDYINQYEVLGDAYEYTVALPFAYDGTSKTSGSGYVKSFAFNIDLTKNPIGVTFNSTNGGTVADIVDNSFHMLSNSITGSLEHQISYTSQVAYVDF